MLSLQRLYRLLFAATSISMSITLPASCACSLHYLANDILPFCIPASALSPMHPTPTPSQHRSTSSSFHPPSASLSIRLSFRLSLDAGFHYTSIGLWLLPSLQAPLSSLPPAAQSPRLCISTPPWLLFLPSVSSSLFLTISLFFALSFLSSSPSVLTIYSICHANPPPSLFILSLLPPSFSFLLSYFLPFLSSSMSCWSCIFL